MQQPQRCMVTCKSRQEQVSMKELQVRLGLVAHIIFSHSLWRPAPTILWWMVLQAFHNA